MGTKIDALQAVLAENDTLYEEGRPVQTIAFDIRDGRVASVYVVRNPDKLARLASLV